MKKLALVFLVVLSCTLVIKAPDFLRESKNDFLRREEYAVYSAVIESHLDFWAGKPFQCVVIEDHTYLDESLLNWTFSSFEGIEQETMNDFFFKNASPYPLQYLFNLDLPVVLISAAEIATLFRGDPSEGWRNFYTRYPHSQGIMELSRVGFNPDMNQAIVYEGNQEFSLSGSGYVHYLVKVNGEWIIQDTISVWIS